jgi:hypothetical protein
MTPNELLELDAIISRGEWYTRGPHYPPYFAPIERDSRRYHELMDSKAEELFRREYDARERPD